MLFFQRGGRNLKLWKEPVHITNYSILTSELEKTEKELCAYNITISKVDMSITISRFWKWTAIKNLWMNRKFGFNFLSFHSDLMITSLTSLLYKYESNSCSFLIITLTLNTNYKLSTYLCHRDSFMARVITFLSVATTRKQACLSFLLPKIIWLTCWRQFDPQHDRLASANLLFQRFSGS